MKPWKKVAGFAVMSSMVLFNALPAVTNAQSVSSVKVQQAGNPANAQVFGNLPGDTQVQVNLVFKLQNKDKLARFIQDTTTPGTKDYRKYLSVSNFSQNYGANPEAVKQLTNYLQGFGIKATLQSNGFIVAATGTADAFNKAFNVQLVKESYNGKVFHGTKGSPTLPADIGNQLLCILGLSDYSSFTSHAVKQTPLLENGTVPNGPLNLSPKDLANQYHVNPLYDKGATGKGQTIGIVTLADFNTEDAYTFWSKAGIPVNPNRITKTNVDGGSGWDGYDETTLDVEQSGALAPDADIHVFVGPNSDTGFVDAFSSAIDENKAQQISVSWGESETVVDLLTQLKWESPGYAEAFNQLFMQAAAQGISTFAAAGDEGAHDAARQLGNDSGLPNATSLSVDEPADSPYITAAGGTTLPFTLHSSLYNMDITNEKERAWGWDYLFPYFNARGLDTPSNWTSRYMAGGGGGFSQVFATPSYQLNVPGVNTFNGVNWWTENADQSSVTRDASPTLVSGTGSGRNLPDISMAADPYTGYAVYFSEPGAPGVDAGYATYGGTSFVAPQLAGLSALINSANGTQAGFWNPQIYRFATQKDSPLHPLNETGATNDNGFYTGTPGTVYNQATGLGTPDVAALANKLK
ncbi:S8/S53 family peptidase [Priestia megaterium]|uniref:S8/S53 family peptidase n=1 Tax=Priestia megaterium TaxID=1404 RepID=A0A6H1P728_PRIMG|nr:S53 family peptidase [Priestia megaterium]QIZ09379.1 S8/S53 family peptidase [Priestia megaterium]